MVETLKNRTPIARKKHICAFCGCEIGIGEKYNRQTNVYDDDVYDWITHIKCEKIAYKLNMYEKESDSDEGLSGEDFREYIGEYVHENHYDSNINDIAVDWDLEGIDLINKIYDEILNK